MITNADRKIMMLKKMTQRLTNEKASFVRELAIKDVSIKTYKNRVQLLMARLKGDGAKAPVPVEFLDSYEFALDYVTKNKYRDNSLISTWKNREFNEATDIKSVTDLKGQVVVDWKVIRMDADLYDLTFVREWAY